MLEKLVMRKRGLVLVTGATGSGKSTTLASMLNYRNENATGHILTIEDPLGFCTPTSSRWWTSARWALTPFVRRSPENALREAPDVIMIGEIRDRNTMKQAIAYAETGHLCLSTLHANNANQAMERVINFFPEEAHRQLLVDLSLNLAGVVSQRLIPGLHEKLVPAVEVMLNSSYISDLIAKGEFSASRKRWRSTEIGMCTFDQALYQLYTEDRISLDEALHNADSRTDLALRIRLAGGFDAGCWRSVHRHILAHPVGRTVGLDGGRAMQHWPFPPFFGMPQGDDTLAGQRPSSSPPQTKPATVHWAV